MENEKRNPRRLPTESDQRTKHESSEKKRVFIQTWLNGSFPGTPMPSCVVCETSSHCVVHVWTCGLKGNSSADPVLILQDKIASVHLVTAV